MVHIGAMCMGLARMASRVRDSICGCGASKGFLRLYRGKIRKFPSLAYKTIWQVGREDPRRLIHAFKVGTSLMLVSLLYLLEPLFQGIGKNAMWAVLTVVVVLEYTAGATLRKGLNRGVGTIIAGSLAFFIEYVANKSSHVFRAIFVASSVFFIGTAATYVRFIPYIKKHYDYGVLIFLMTFNLITVSSYRINDVISIGLQRSYIIAIGCGICLLMSLLVFPHWSGEDLHDSTVSKLEGLAKSIEACVDNYFKESISPEVSEEEKVSDDDPIYKAVLDSKSTDETSAQFASWEPCNTRYCFRFPWKQYVKVGTVLRHFGYTVVALHGCLRTEIQTPKAVRALFKDPCIRLASEVSKVLLELADSVRNRRHCNPSILSENLHETLKDLDTALKSQPRLFLNPTIDVPSPSSPTTNLHNLAAAAAARSAGLPKPTPTKLTPNPTIPSSKTDTSALIDWKRKHNKGIDISEPIQSPSREGLEKKMLRPTLSKIAITSLEFAEALPFAAFASLLVETVARLDLVIEEVEELGRVAQFKDFVPGDEVVIDCDDQSTSNGGRNHLQPHGCE